jgi:hypothetical protein
VRLTTPGGTRIGALDLAGEVGAFLDYLYVLSPRFAVM